MDSRELRTIQEAYLEVYENQQLDEVEGYYGRTPKAERGFKDLLLKRHREGATRKSVDTARTHADRVNNPDAGHTGRKSPRPVEDGTHRRKMTQDDRDVARQRTEYDPDDLYYGPQSDGPKGSLPKGKKLARQRKTGVSAESFDIYDIILSHLLDEGYAETPEAAEVIMVNMSEDWRESICEVKGLGGFIPKGGTTYSGHYDDDHPRSNRKRVTTDYFYARGTESGLSMSPEKRAETAAKRAEREGTPGGRRRANTIRARIAGA